MLNFKFIPLYLCLTSYCPGTFPYFGQIIFQCKVENLKNSKKFWQGPPKGREGKPEFFRFFLNFQLCIERFFDLTKRCTSIVIITGDFVAML